MISTLHIKNIGIIDDLSIDFNEGLNILTGETGAGKSILMGSVNLALGGKASKDFIQPNWHGEQRHTTVWHLSVYGREWTALRYMEYTNQELMTAMRSSTRT